MSAYVLDREHFVAIAAYLGEHKAIDKKLYVYHPVNMGLRPDGRLTGSEVANILMTGNILSVAYRYDEDPKSMEMKAITNRDTLVKTEVGDHKIEALVPMKKPSPLSLVGVLRSLQYQSCEVPDYENTLAYATLNALLWRVATDAANVAGERTWA